jgi:hypothetical protein
LPNKNAAILFRQDWSEVGRTQSRCLASGKLGDGPGTNLVPRVLPTDAPIRRIAIAQAPAPEDYSNGAKLFHWLVVALVVIQFGGLGDAGLSPRQDPSP